MEKIYRGMCPTCMYGTRKVHRLKGVVSYVDPETKNLRVFPIGKPMQASFQLNSDGKVEAFEDGVKGDFHVHIVTQVEP